MKIRRLMALLLTVMLVMSLSVCASAETAAPAWSINAREVSLSEQTKTMAVMGVESRLYALYDADGNPLTEEKYLRMDVKEMLYKVAAESGMNVWGYMDAAGQIVVPMIYGDLIYCSDKWQMGVRLTPATADNYDYKTLTGDAQFYLVEAYDVYYCGTKVGELGRTDYYNAYAHGDYLYVANKDRIYTYYNKEFVASGYAGYNAGAEYEETRSGVWHRGSNQQAFVAGCTLTSDEVVIDIMEIDGKMLDLQGNVLFEIDPKYDYVSEYKGDYARVTMNNKDGLIDRTGREVVPCEYDEFSYENEYFEGGYQIAIKDGKVGFVNTDGEVTAEFKYSESVVKRTYTMPFTYLNDLDGSFIVISGVVGELSARYKDVDLGENGCPLFVGVNDKDQAGVFNVYGDAVIAPDGTYDDTYNLQISADGTVVVGYAGDRVYNVYKLTESEIYGEAGSEEPEEAPAQSGNEGAVAGGALMQQTVVNPTEAPAQEEAQADDGSWKCSNGHANTGKFCAECGEARPADELKCSKCGYKPEAGKTPKFCAECGNAF